MSPKCLYLVCLDIPPELEAEFNQLYDQEHIPNLLKVPGVHSCRRYRLVSAQPVSAAKYLAIYELDSPMIRQSAAWQQQSDSGYWKTRIRPYTTNKAHLFFEPIAASTLPPA
jgi:hypothetical protein